MENVIERFREIKESVENIQNLLPTTTTTTTTTRSRPTLTTKTTRSTRTPRPNLSPENFGPIQDLIDKIMERFNGTIDVPRTCLVWDEIWSPGLPLSISAPKQMCFAGAGLDLIVLAVFAIIGFRIDSHFRHSALIIFVNNNHKQTINFWR